MARLMPVKEAAAELGLTEYMVRAEFKRGMLPGNRVGRRGLVKFTKADLDVYEGRIAAETSLGLTPRSARNLRKRTHRI